MGTCDLPRAAGEGVSQGLFMHSDAERIPGATQTNGRSSHLSSSLRRCHDYWWASLRSRTLPRFRAPPAAQLDSAANAYFSR